MKLSKRNQENLPSLHCEGRAVTPSAKRQMRYYTHPHSRRRMKNVITREINTSIDASDTPHCFQTASAKHSRPPKLNYLDDGGQSSRYRIGQEILNEYVNSVNVHNETANKTQVLISKSMQGRLLTSLKARDYRAYTKTFTSCTPVTPKNFLRGDTRFTRFAFRKGPTLRPSQFLKRGPSAENLYRLVELFNT